MCRGEFPEVVRRLVTVKLQSVQKWPWLVGLLKEPGAQCGDAIVGSEAGEEVNRGDGDLAVIRIQALDDFGLDLWHPTP